MRIWLSNRLNALRASYWFLPGLLALGAILLSQATLELDQRWAGSELLTWAYPGSPEGARVLLSTIGGSMIGVAGVTFSVTVVALTMASSQLGPRLLRSFLRDRPNQLVLGTFIATYLYCLLSLRAVSSARDFVPAVSVTIAVAMALVSVGVLIFFIHHVTTSLQADHVVASVAADLLASVERFTASGKGVGETPSPAAAEATKPRPEALPQVSSQRHGYVQAVDYAKLFRLACEGGIVIHARRRAGGFTLDGGALAVIEEGLDESSEESIRACFLIGSLRTEEQDVCYALNQLVEVALRALSPGINDPFTAITCIDWLGASLSKVLAAGVPHAAHADAEGRVRLTTDEPGFPELLSCAFDPIRQAARETPAVTTRLADALTRLAPFAKSEPQREVLRRQVELLGLEIRSSQRVAEDLLELQRRLASLARELEPTPQDPSGG